jgi:hypothetical protein
MPEFADHGELNSLLAEHNVIVDAQPADTGVPWWETLIVGLLPTPLIFALLFAAILGFVIGLALPRFRRRD